jgi:hypothetical protein
MSYERAYEQMKRFADKVMPVLKATTAPEQVAAE